MVAWLLLLGGLLSAPIAPAETSTAPAGLDRVLRGAQSGVTLEAFKGSHPDAVQEPPQEAPPSDASTGQIQTAALVEKFSNDPLLGLECLANYGFKNDLLTEWVVLWGGSQEDVTRQRRAFFEACVWKYGPHFRRDVMQVNPHTENPPLVPALFWEQEKVVYLASLAWNPESQRAPGTFTFAMYPKGDAFLDQMLLADDLAPEVVRDAFAELDLVLNDLTGLGGVAVPGR
ncbi:MAG: hypothetical protein HYV26_12905 [Candidatus Hydrogenedentes bacterium]|nr:hypothetical protein [Candidatus Hydrogenedentota bacterium]